MAINPTVVFGYILQCRDNMTFILTSLAFITRQVRVPSPGGKDYLERGLIHMSTKRTMGGRRESLIRVLGFRDDARGSSFRMMREKRSNDG